MLLNSTLRLGYLEGDHEKQATLKLDEKQTTLKLDEKQTTLKLESRPGTRERRPSTGERRPSGERRGSKERPLSRQGSRSKESWRLEWTHAPLKEVQKDGPMVYSVSTPAKEGPREHQPHLVRTTRIEPTGYSKKRPPTMPQKREQITVSEKDLLKCGSDLRKLRECNIVDPVVERTLPSAPPPAPLPPPLELSFRSKFAQDCREGADPRDPWKDLRHPDEDRVLTVEDLVLNQVYIKALLPRKVEIEDNSPERGRGKASKLRRSLSASTRASSADLSRQTWPDDGRKKWSTKRASSLGRAESTVEEPVIRCPSAIQPVSTATPRSHRGDETPEAKRAARAFLKGAHKRGEMRAVWMALDQATGDVELYHQEAGGRLEAAWRSGRSSVPLAGLQPELEGAIVTFERAEATGRLRRLHGVEAMVKRFEVTAYSYEMRIEVVGPPRERAWRFAKSQEPGEERLVPLIGTELVSPPSPSLPPVSRSRPTYFINEGAHWAVE